jgi:addiction module RelE/StbE family toxin
MWTILERKGLRRDLLRLPVEIKKGYEKWKDVVRLSGPSGLRLIKGFHDEALKGRWSGHRSSRLGDKYRVIYCQENDQFIVKVVSVTAHDYRVR